MAPQHVIPDSGPSEIHVKICVRAGVCVGGCGWVWVGLMHMINNDSERERERERNTGKEQAGVSVGVWGRV